MIDKELSELKNDIPNIHSPIPINITVCCSGEDIPHI